MALRFESARVAGVESDAAAQGVKNDTSPLEDASCE